MKDCYRGSAWRKLHLHRTTSLRRSWRQWASLPLQKSARPLGKKRLLLQRMTRFFKRCSTVNVKTLPFFVKLAFGLSQRPSVHGRSASSIYRAGVSSRSRLATSARQRAVGLLQGDRPSTCRTSSAVRSYAKQSWHRWGTSLSSGTFRKLNLEYLRGFRITKICSTSSALAVTLMPRSVLRCSTYPAFQKKAILILGSLQSQRCSAVGMGLAGHLSLPNFSLDSLEHRPYATTWPLRRSSGSRLTKRRSSSTGT